MRGWTCGTRAAEPRPNRASIAWFASLHIHLRPQKPP